jgi:hypothetical protein
MPARPTDDGNQPFVPTNPFVPTDQTLQNLGITREDWEGYLARRAGSEHGEMRSPVTPGQKRG